MTAKRPISKKSNLARKGHSEVLYCQTKAFLLQLRKFGSLIFRNKENVLKIMGRYHFIPSCIVVFNLRFQASLLNH